MLWQYVQYQRRLTVSILQQWMARRQSENILILQNCLTFQLFLSFIIGFCLYPEERNTRLAYKSLS